MTLQRCTVCMGLNRGRRLQGVLGVRCACLLLGPTTMVACTEEVARTIEAVVPDDVRPTGDDREGTAGYAQWIMGRNLARRRSTATGIARDLSLVPRKTVTTLRCLAGELEAGPPVRTTPRWVWVTLFNVEETYDLSNELGHRLRHWDDVVLTRAKGPMLDMPAYRRDWKQVRDALRTLADDLERFDAALPGPLLEAPLHP
jgi:hypothetical protein